LRVPDVDNFIARSIAIGNALYFRELLYKALEAVADEEIPQIKACIRSGFNQYNRNIFMAFDFVPMDTLAHDIGVDVGVADQELKTILITSAQSDSKLWNLLPTLYASSFAVSTYWRDAVYRPAIEAIENNVHVLSKTISELIISFKALTTDSEEERVIGTLLGSYLEISSVFLLRMFKGTKEKNLPRDLPSVVIFLDLFVQNCPVLTRNTLESCMPYAFLRSMWRDLYSRKPQKADHLPEQEEVF